MYGAYSVSHIYDETGSAKARHFEALKAAQARKLADTVRRDDGRLIRRVLSRLQAGLVAVSGKPGPWRGEDVQVARL